MSITRNGVTLSQVGNRFVVSYREGSITLTQELKAREIYRQLAYR